MRTPIITLLSLIVSFCSFGQNFIMNPGFENTTLATGCYTNQTSAAVTAALDNVTAFYGGTMDGIDIGVNATCYSGGANSGAVHVVLAGLSAPNMFESLSFDLNSPIVNGATYNLSFYAANSSNVNPESLKIGVSNSATSFGTLLTTVSLGTSSSYVQYSTSFTATADGAYLTIEPGALGDFWFGLDDFELSLNSPPCTTPPTAICQAATVYLDGSGNGTLNPDDLDGGSLDNCGTSGLTFSASQTAFTCAEVSAGGSSPADALIVTGVIDGPLPGGLPKAIEIYVASNVADLSQYGISSANNGTGATGTPEFDFPAAAATAGDFIYVATDSVNFNAWFGFFPNYTDGMASINGDDAIELFYSGNVVDIFGDVNTDGTGQPWEYLDGWAYRDDATGPDGSVFAIGNWSFSGVDALDTETTNASAATPFPVGTYAPAASGMAITLTVTDGNANTATCMANVTVMDTLLPTGTAPAMVSVECLGDVPAADSLIITDEADNCGTATVTWSGDVSDGLSCPETITRTYIVSDDHGNSIDLIQLIVVNDVTDPTASAPATINVECIGDVPAADILVVNDEVDNCGSPTVAHVGDVSDGLTCPETITRTYSITDDCGNSINVDQTIVVNDVTGPVADNTLNAISGQCDVTPPTPTATDNCSGVINGVPDVSFPITTAGTTTVIWTYTDVCGNATTQSQDVVISPIDLTTSVNGLTISANAVAQDYQWIDCSDNSPIAGETGMSFTATTNGDYAVIIYTVDLCFDTTACVTIDDVSLQDLTIETLVLYPNPTQSGIFTINYDGIIKEITLIDMVGRIVDVPVSLESGSVDGTQLAAGQYTVQVITENDKTVLGTVIVQR